MALSTLTSGLARSVDNLAEAVTAPFSDPVIRLGVTGLARAGKTVFITSLVANLLDRGRMTQLLANAEGRIEAAYLQPQPDDTVPRFDYEHHLHAMTGPEPHWPESTRAVSELRLSLKVRPTGMLSGFSGPRTVHLDIVDYPGEWLLDLGLLEKSYEDWSAEVIARHAPRPEAAQFRAALDAIDASAPFDEMTAKRLAAAYTESLNAAREAGFYDMTPGRFLLPGEMAGSPVLTFAPLPPREGAARRSFYREMARRFEAYKSRVVRPFFRDHFSRIDRQVVLVDALGAIHAGPQSVEDLRCAMRDILGAFRPGRNAWLTQLFRGRRVEKILFAATKADHLHHTQHPQLTAVMQALVRDARDKAQFAGAKTHAMSIASLRATVETEVPSPKGAPLPAVQGRLLDSGKRAALYPGALPEDPGVLLGQARAGADTWLGQDYAIMRFAPSATSLRPGEGPPHIRLDKAAEFLFGDRL